MKATSKNLVVAAVMALCVNDADASDSFFSRYNLGLSYASSANYASISYETTATGAIPSDCNTSEASTGNMRCRTFLSPDGVGSYNISAYLKKPFKRQGLFYFEPGFTFSTVSYKGTLGSEPSNTIGTGSTKKSTTPSADQPLTSASIELYGVNWQGYLEFGITPLYIPDLFLSAGLGLQTVGGTVHVFQERATTYFAQPEAFGELELVFVRYKTGALSLYGNIDQSLHTPIGTALISDNPSGTDTTNYKVNLQSSSYGVRLLFPF